MKYLIIIFICCIVGTSCNKVVTDDPVFDVTTNSTTYKIGDTIKFNVTGKSNYIVFYSGEFGKEYKYASRGYLTGGKPTVSFLSTVTGTVLPDTLLKVFLSTDFNGTNNTVAGISAANWTDTTSRFALSSGTANTASGNVDISNLVSADSTPVTIGFRYRVPASRITNWSIQNFAVNTIMTDGYTAPIYNLASGFTAVDFLNTAVKWTASAASLSTSGTSATSTASEDWVVSKPFFPYRITMDLGTSIKSIADTDPTTYLYRYTAAGKYTVTFVSKNSNVYDSKVIVKTFDLTITP
jgi:hypothetical protein